MATSTGEKKAVKATRNKKTAAQLKAEMEKARKKYEELERRAYAEELEELVKKQNIVSSFNAIKDSVKGVSDLAILSAIGKAAGISRLVVTQTPAKPRKKTVK